ncbi:MAG: hypothetical protein OES15_03935 [Nitrosopumilus sp.]|nr:hypothetical protein [Nitrosopumilus sp.]
MALFSKEKIGNPENIISENKTNSIIYQMNSSDVKTDTEKMKKDIDEVTRAMESARNTTYEKKIMVNEIKTKLTRKKNEMEELQDKLESVRKHVGSEVKKLSDLEIEINKIKTTLEKIKEAGQNLDPKYLEQSQNDLINTLVKVTSEYEKTQSDLNAIKKIEEITSKKLQNIQMDFNKLETYAVDRINETEMMITNVSTTIEQVIKSYNEITTVAKELLKSAVATKIELKEDNNYKIEQNQPYQEFKNAKIAI